MTTNGRQVALLSKRLLVPTKEGKRGGDQGWLSKIRRDAN